MDGELGKTYRSGESIIRQGEAGDARFVIQHGQVEVYREHEGKTVRLAVLNAGEFFGEMALVEREVRSAGVRALGDVRVLTIDKRTFIGRIHDDPSLAYRIVQKLSARIRELDRQLEKYHPGG